MQAIELAPAAEAVRTLKEFVAEAGAHLGGVRGDVAGVAEVEALGVVTANDHGEGVLETERLGDFKIETLAVALFHSTVNIVRIAAGRFGENSGKSGAGVLDVEVEVAGEEGFLTEERAAKIGFVF